MEIWKSVLGYEGLYEVSDLGRVRSLDRLVRHPRGVKSMLKGKNLKPAKERSGYLSVTFSLEGKINPMRIHVLVAKTFIPNPDNKKTVNHKNGIKDDNRSENLEWTTQSENLHHAFEMGLSKSGDNHYLSKLTKEQVLKIRELFSTGKYSKAELGRMFNVGRKTCSSLINGKTWKHI